MVLERLLSQCGNEWVEKSEEKYEVCCPNFNIEIGKLVRQIESEKSRKGDSEDRRTKSDLTHSDFCLDLLLRAMLPSPSHHQLGHRFPLCKHTSLPLPSANLIPLLNSSILALFATFHSASRQKLPKLGFITWFFATEGKSLIVFTVQIFFTFPYLLPLFVKTFSISVCQVENWFQVF